MEKLRILREECGDRAVLRALHYLDENKRVILATEAIKKRRWGGSAKYY
jgi:galactokinase